MNGWDFFANGNHRTCLCTDSQGEEKKEIKVDSSFIWLSTWVVELPFSGRGTSWRWGS